MVTYGGIKSVPPGPIKRSQEYQMELFCHDTNGQPALVIDIREDIEIRDLTSGYIVYTLESDGDGGSFVIRFKDGISVSSNNHLNRDPLSLAVELAQDIVYTSDDDEMPDCPECARSFGPSYDGPCDH